MNKIDINDLPKNKSELEIIISSLILESEELNSKFNKLKLEYQSLSEEKQLWSEEKEGLVEEKILSNKKNRELLERILYLEEQIKKLLHKQFGVSSEKVKRKISDLEHQIEESEISLGLNIRVSGAKKDSEKGKAKRHKIPEDMPRENINLDGPKECCECGSKSLRKIGEDVSEVLEYIPSTFKAIKYIRPRLVCKECEKMNQSYPASKAIDKGKVGCGLLAHIMVQKYCNHLPLYRQSQIYERESSVNISRSTMGCWLGQASRLLEPLIEVLREEIFKAEKLHGDDTPIKVLEPGAHKTKQGRIWVYALDGRPYNNNTPTAVCYYYSPDRKGERPESHLANFKGILQTDAYAGYNNTSSISRAGCWAHVRRKFYEITIVSENATVAHETIDIIQSLYEIEEKVRYKSPDQRLDARQQYSKQIVEDLFKKFREVLKKLSKKGSTAKAIQYALNNEIELKQFLNNGIIEIDNNIAERALRSIAVGRKNWLFAGSDQGGETAANIYSLIETAKLNNINPWQYLKKVLTVIQDYNSQKLHELLPWNIQLDST